MNAAVFAGPLGGNVSVTENVTPVVAGVSASDGQSVY